MSQTKTEVLAINGGDPVRTKPMPFRKAFGPDELKAVNEVIEFYQQSEQDPGYQGHFEIAFCKAFEEYMGGGHADAVSSGTNAIYVALQALQLPQGSEVIISPMTDSGPLNCIILLGYKPVLADSRPETYNVGVDQFLERVTDQTSCFLAVHSAGEPLDMPNIMREARKRNIKVLEDCSQVTGGEVGGKKVGTWGDIAAFSTMYRKVLTAGASSGLVYSTNKDYFHKSLAYADRGKPIWRRDIYLNDPSCAMFPALNMNTDEISCAIGRSSLHRLDEAIEARKKLLEKLISLMSERSKACRPYAYHDGFSPFFFPIFVDESKITCTKTEFAQAVKAEGIGLLPHYGCLITLWDWAKEYLSDDFVTKNALKIRDTSFNYFVNEQYGEQEALDTIEAIVKVEHTYLKG